MNVLLTGHGTLGEPLAQRLVALGHSVRVLSRAPRDKLPWEVVTGRLDDFESVLSAVRDCQLVIHNGGRQAGQFDVTAHPDFVRANVAGAANVFNAAIREGVRQVIHISCDSVLGAAPPQEAAETASRARCVRDGDPFQAHTILDVSKIAAEQLGRYYREQHGLCLTTLRPGWFAGPDQLADEQFAYRLLSQCVWVGDVIAAVLAATTNPAQGEYLVHAPVPFTDADANELICDSAAVLRRYWPGETQWWLAQRYPTPPIRAWADITPARDQLGFEPQLGFAQAVQRMRAGKSPWPTAGLKIAR